MRTTLAGAAASRTHDCATATTHVVRTVLSFARTSARTLALLRIATPRLLTVTTFSIRCSLHLQRERLRGVAQVRVASQLAHLFSKRSVFVFQLSVFSHKRIQRLLSLRVVLVLQVDVSP